MISFSSLENSPFVMVDDHLFKLLFPSTIVPGSRHGKLMYLGFSGSVPLVLLVPLDCSILYRFVLVVLVQRVGSREVWLEGKNEKKKDLELGRGK